MKKHFLSLLLGLILCCCCLTGCSQNYIGKGTLILSEGTDVSAEFNDLLNDWFVTQIQKDPLICHYTLSDQEAYGISFDTVTFPELSLEQSKADQKEYKSFLDELHGFAYKELDSRQQLTSDILTSYYENAIDLLDYYYYQDLLSPSEGIPASLPVLLSSYTFSDSQDIYSYLDLLDDVDIYFNQVALFAGELQERGLLPAASSLTSTISFCRSFCVLSSDHLLLTTFDDRISDCDFLTETERQKFITRNYTLVSEVVLPSYEKLAEVLEPLANSSDNTGCLAHLPDGQNYYALLIQQYTGTDMAPFLLYQEIALQREADMEKMASYFLQDPSLAYKISDAICPLEDPQEMITVLQNAITADYPSFPETALVISEISSQMRDYTAPAFYFISPIDDIRQQYIFYDPSSFSTALQLFTTMAHEAFPGHLYQTIQSYSYGQEAVRSLLSFPGYTEGWATYVEMESYYYAGLSEELAAVLSLNQSVVLSLYATADIGIHYYGWGKNDLMEFLDDYGVTTESIVHEIYQLILDSPGNYLKYAVGYLNFRQLRQDMKDSYPDTFSLMDFHKAILQIGPAPFSTVKEQVQLIMAP
jgi:uncharacterized protein (DUF885 family)